MVVLVVIILLVFIAPYIYQLFHKDSTINGKDFDKALALIKQAKVSSPAGLNNDDAPANDQLPHPVLFNFNPNNLPDKQWKLLGLSERQVSIIKHYEAKGGHFYKKEDVQKIYAITDSDYRRMEPYIKIPGADYVSNKVQPGTIIELNKADSARLTRVRGIGPAFAVRIIEYRNRLGGFLNKEQLKEVYGVDTLKYAQLKNEISVDPAHITKIKINDVDFEGLRKFPYLTNKQTNAVIQYRKQHGDYQSAADLKNIAILDENIIHKIEPYLSFK